MTARLTPMTVTRHDVLDTLVESMAAGDQAAFARLYDTTVARVSGSIRRYLPDASSDAMIENVYVELWRTAPARRVGDGDAASWISSTLGSVVARHRTPTAPLIAI